MESINNPALAALRHHVTGAVERGEATAIVEVPFTGCAFCCGGCSFCAPNDN